VDLDSALTGKPADGASATDVLRADHREVRNLFSEYDSARGAGHARDVIAQTIAMQVELHDTIEREVFYPAVQSFAQDLVEHAMRAHDEIAQLMESVKADDTEGARRDELVAELQRALEEHLRDEEQALFPAVEKHLGGALRELGGALVKRKEELTRSTESLENPAT
jgi:hemerythrin superfamily protein